MLKLYPEVTAIWVNLFHLLIESYIVEFNWTKDVDIVVAAEESFFVPR